MSQLLTPRELEVWSKLAEGKTCKEVAAELGTSPSTIETHETNLHRKLKLHTRGELVRRAFLTGLAALVLAALPAAADLAVTLAWYPNPEPDIAGYMLYYGNASRSYTATTNATGTNVTIAGLAETQPYFFAVTARNTAGQESDFSNEVSWTPASPPRAPAGLRIVATAQERTLALETVIRPTLEAPWQPLTTQYFRLQTNGIGFYGQKLTSP